MKSIEMSSPRACGRADTANASMLNAKRIFFIIVKGLRGVRLFRPVIYSTSDSKCSSAPRCSKTTDLNHRLHGCHGLGSARGNGIPEIEGKGAQCGAEQGGSHASLTVHRNEILFYSGNQEHRNTGNGSHGLLFRERRVPAFFIVLICIRTIRVIRGFPPIHDSTIYAVKARGAQGALRAPT